ncbi:MAG: RNA pyrophosphohydrolase [Rhodospirillaceae bacterium]|jgi:putative (di)nucleoside polyphosphate hydrolase|nr:RNA pyrophosphohydrolase [Rhodospirillaceae bacterium]
MCDLLPYRPGVGLMLFNSHGLVFVANRIDVSCDAWQMPQGGIDDNETPRQAVFRELKEEIGTDNVEIISESANWLHYDFPSDPNINIRMLKFRGQIQKWFALRFIGSDSDININTEHPEFCDWQWINFDRLLDLIVPFKLDLYRSVIYEFRPIANRLAIDSL